jgi:acetolactate synthase-1/2/3 large subunit
MVTGADALCRALAARGVSHLFGLPGSQSVDLWDALRRADAPRPVVAAHELAASFMAIGYARASGRPGVVATIPGPGFMYALTGLAEALLDSVPLVHVTIGPAERADGAPALQALRQSEIAAPLVKRVIEAPSPDRVEGAVDEALALASAGEPGPVLLQVPEAVLGEGAGRAPARSAPPPAGERAELDELLERIAAAARPVFLCGAGAAGGAEALQVAVEALSAPVLTTTSGRGVLPETHPLSLPFDSPGASPAVVNELLDTADLVVVVGAKLSHNGSHGFSLRLAPEKLVRIDASVDVSAGPYSGGTQVTADAPAFLAQLARRVEAEATAPRWSEEELGTWRARLAAAARVAEPGVGGLTPAELFASLRAALPARAVVTTDSGLHQYLVRRHLPVLAPRTLLVPADLQSMGFGVPAALGATVATGGRAVAVVGDGGFAISGLELATAVQLELPVTVVVLVDRAFGLIRAQQRRRTGSESGVDLPAIDLAHAAAAVGARHAVVDAGNVADVLGGALGPAGVHVLEVPVTSTTGPGARDLAVRSARAVLGVPRFNRLGQAAKRRSS